MIYSAIVSNRYGIYAKVNRSQLTSMMTTPMMTGAMMATSMMSTVMSTVVLSAMMSRWMMSISMRSNIIIVAIYRAGMVRVVAIAIVVVASRSRVAAGRTRNDAIRGPGPGRIIGRAVAVVAVVGRRAAVIVVTSHCVAL